MCTIRPSDRPSPAVAVADGSAASSVRPDRIADVDRAIRALDRHLPRFGDGASADVDADETAASTDADGV